MARKHPQDSYSDADYGYEEDFSYEDEEEEPTSGKKGFFSRFKRREIDEDDVYEDESYDDDYDEYEEEEEVPRRSFFKSFGRKKKDEPEYEEFEDDYDDSDEDDGYEDEYEDEDEKPRFRLFGGRSRKAEPEEEYERYAEPQDYDDGDAVGLDSILTTVLAVLMAVALAAGAFAVVTLLQSGKNSAKEAPVEKENPAVTETMAPAESAAQPAEQTVPEATPEPTGTKAELTAEGILVPGERGPVVPERDVKKSIEEFATVTMIGNSFVEGMKLWSDINCEYVCADGVSLDNMIGNHLYFVTVRDYDAIYLTLGLNEIGWPVDSFISKYEKVIDYIRSDAYSKTATIYITSVMPVEKIMETQKAESGYTINLSKIQTFNNALKEMCQRKGVWYLDVYSALADAEGYLPPEVAADDHVHFEKTGYRIWTEYLQNHYVDESLLEGN